MAAAVPEFHVRVTPTRGVGLVIVGEAHDLEAKSKAEASPLMFGIELPRKETSWLDVERMEEGMAAEIVANRKEKSGVSKREEFEKQIRNQL